MPDATLTPPTTTLAEVWRAIGAAGTPAGLYDGRTVHPERLDELLSGVDRRGDNGVTLAVLVQAASALPLLGAAARPGTWQADVHERVLAGDGLLALAATDAAAPGSDLPALGTELVEDGPLTDDGGLRLTGGKRWIAGAGAADHLLVLARTAPGRHFTALRWVLVEAGDDRVHVRPATGELLAGSHTAHVEFDGVPVGTRHLVGRPGRGMAEFARCIGVERLGAAYWAIALTGRVLSGTRDALRGRVVGGAPLADNPVVAHELARCLVRIHELRALTDALAGPIAAGADLTTTAVLKISAAAAVDDVLTRCAHLHGADGFGPGGIARTRAESGVFGIGGGATEVMLDVVAGAFDTLADGVLR